MHKIITEQLVKSLKSKWVDDDPSSEYMLAVVESPFTPHLPRRASKQEEDTIIEEQEDGIAEDVADVVMNHINVLHLEKGWERVSAEALNCDAMRVECCLSSEVINDVWLSPISQDNLTECPLIDDTSLTLPRLTDLYVVLVTWDAVEMNSFTYKGNNLSRYATRCLTYKH